MADDSWIGVADTHNVAATGGDSIVDYATDWVAKGIPLAMASGVTSILNTGISLGNMFGADVQPIDFKDKIQNYDDDLLKYYQDHQAGVDLGGFAITSLAPGTLGMKGLKALQVIKDGEGIGKNTYTIAGYFRGQQERYLQAAAEAVKAPTQQVYAAINVDKLKAVAAGFVEQALQGAAFETGVLLTMNQNPVLEPDARDNYVQNLWKHLPQSAENALVFGALGGLFEAATITGKVNALKRAEDLKQFPYLLGEQIGLNNLSKGTVIAYGFDKLVDYKSTLTEMQVAMQGPELAGRESLVSSKSVLNQVEKVKNYERDIELFITKNLMGKEDIEIAKVLRTALADLKPVEENGYTIKPSELVARIFGGAKSADRVGDVDLLEQTLRKYFEDPENLVPGARLHGATKEIGQLQDKFSGDVRNILGDGLYTSDNSNVTKGYAVKFGEENAVVYRLQEKTPVNLYNADKIMSPELRTTIADIVGRQEGIDQYVIDNILNTKQSLLDFHLNYQAYVRSSRKDLGGMQEIFSAIQDVFAEDGYRGYTHIGGFLGGAAGKHKVNIYWNPASDLNVVKSTSGVQEKLIRTFTPFIKTGPQAIFKMAGENKGNIKSSVYPVIADLGKPTVKNGKPYIDGVYREVPEKFLPGENSPTDSNIQFWLARNSDKPFPKEIEAGDIPHIEAAMLKGIPREEIKITGLKGADDSWEAILKGAKDDAIVELTNQGLGKDYISRALNVPEKYLEGSSQELSLARVEDHSVPMHIKLNYKSQRDNNSFMAFGMREVDKRVAISTVQREAAAANTFGEAFNNLPKPKGELNNVTTQSGAATLTKFSDAARGSTMQDAMLVAKILDAASKDQATNWQNALYALRQAIKTSDAALYSRNITAGTLRAFAEPAMEVPLEILNNGKLDIIPKSVLDVALKDKDPAVFIKKFLAEAPTAAVSLDRTSLEAQYLLARRELNIEQVKKWNMMEAARGGLNKRDPFAFYEPPVDTTRQPFFAMIRHKSPLDDLRPVSMIFAQDAAGLAAKKAQIEAAYGDTLEVFTKADIKTNHELQGVYDHARDFGNPAIDSQLQKLGKLSDFIPRKDAYIFDEEDQWIWRQAQGIHRQAVELLYGTEIAELRFLAKNWDAANSRFADEAKNRLTNPYTQVVNTYLNLSNKNTYQAYWGKFNEGMQAAWSAATGAWEKGFKDAQDGKLTYQQAEKIAQDAGYTAPFGKISQEVFSETFKDNNSLGKIVSKINMAASTLMIRMDPLNSLINTMSLSVLLSAETTAVRQEIQKKLGLSVTVPGGTHQIPSLMSMLIDGTKSFWNKETLVFSPTGHLVDTSAGNVAVGGGFVIEFKQLLRDAKIMRTDIQQIQDSLSIPLFAVKSGEKGAIEYASNLAKTVGEFGAKYSGNNLAEEFVRYQAAYAGLQFAKALGITERGELLSYMNLTVNRMHGNYLASQRPTIFSGPVGQAISLFQTYQFNMIQQMTRHLQEGNYKSAGVALGMQNAIFGLQGNPLFWQLNQYIGNQNTNHGDIVSGIASVIGTGGGYSDPAKWLLYGLGANALQVNLYNRGDLTPRYTTILPTSFQDIPAISIGTKAINSFFDTVKSISNGAPVPDSILQGVAHAGFNRPLAGLASVIAGERTTNSGTLLATYNDFLSFTTAAKLAGGEPLNNAIAIDAFNRFNQYSTDKAKKMQDLAEAVKLTTAGHPGIDPAQTTKFMQEYASRGGDMKHFNQFMIHATKYSNQSAINIVKEKMGNPMAKNSLNWMGAVDDYRNQLPADAGGE